MAKVSPSILSADFVNLERDIQSLAAAGADYVHVDVMDGCFVPNITIGIPVVAAIRRVTELPLDVHLMIDRPVRYVEAFCQAGADILTVHVEADSEKNTRTALQKIRDCGVRPAVSVKPGGVKPGACRGGLWPRAWDNSPGTGVGNDLWSFRGRAQLAPTARYGFCICRGGL